MEGLSDTAADYFFDYPREANMKTEEGVLLASLKTVESLQKSAIGDSVLVCRKVLTQPLLQPYSKCVSPGC